MANEITCKVYVDVNKTGVPSITKAPAQFQITMTGTDLILATQAIGTSAENIAKGEITTPGIILVHNLGPTNYVEIGHDVAAAFEADVKLKVDEWALFRMTQATPQARANTSGVQIEYLMIED